MQIPGKYRYNRQSTAALHELVDDSYETVLRLNSEPCFLTGHATGFIDLDHILKGLQPGNLTVLASRPSMGKTVLALNIAQNVSVNNSISTAIFSLEMSKELLAMRMLLATAQIDLNRVRTRHLQEADLTRIDAAKEPLRKSTIYIDDTSGLTASELLARVIGLKVDHNVQIIIIDYLQLMRNDAGTDLTSKDMSMISSSLKALARELNISIIVLSRLHASVDERKRKNRRPRLSDLRDTGSLENDADVILFLHRETVYCKWCRRRDGSCVHNHEQEAELIIAKHKNGPVGSVFLSFLGETARFEDK